MVNHRADHQLYTLSAEEIKLSDSQNSGVKRTPPFREGLA